MTLKNASYRQRIGLFVTVFLTGASVMVIELLGTRMIAPFYGASLYVWSSLISVTMIALAFGYFTGGRLADSSKPVGLAVVIALAAFLTLLIPWMTRPILLMTDPLGLRGGAFVSSFILFAPALTLLGMVGPFAIKLATLQLNSVGSSSGSIYAMSTLGSVIGTLILGFFLFPLVGSREILIVLGLLLMGLALVIALIERRTLGFRYTVAPCLALATLGLVLLPGIIGSGKTYDGNGKFKIVSEHESLYGWVRVIDQPGNDLRMLTSDASTIGAASISTGKNLLIYQEIVGLIPALRPSMQRALIVGLGAGHMANVLRERFGLVVDTLEIDPAVANAAVVHFGYESNGRDIVGDARYEIRHLTGPYDLIIHDCFTGGSEPSYLLTLETLMQLKGLLDEQGILALNFVSFTQGNNEALSSVAKTLDQVFSRQIVFFSQPRENFNDFIFLASDAAIESDSPQLKPSERLWLKQRRYQVPQDQGIVLTDNFNPLEQMQVYKAEHYRNVVVGWFGADLLLR
ncbi:fused MFS/spermidine synthase [Methylotuvimicrobium alcaliphilum]|uniref:PABS domain-containing protein n=1 Tax=Methylotuvimicrobium alcaliphilum (strain DSM 19304 / NCIMB 14124 / VKM B-2133 / 20Z) TaxID=1091494 RepID=G4T2B5_META2|nr:fused MFS/spermidine synthase [Methylotuvimicrobium alcaliphilum]CCE23555.1 conserved membrane protein of unknown function [Methylotuvimicrobium alcaliphilum 20Z]